MGVNIASNKLLSVRAQFYNYFFIKRDFLIITVDFFKA